MHKHGIHLIQRLENLCTGMRRADDSAYIFTGRGGRELLLSGSFWILLLQRRHDLSFRTDTSDVKKVKVWSLATVWAFHRNMLTAQKIDPYASICEAYTHRLLYLYYVLSALSLCVIVKQRRSHSYCWEIFKLCGPWYNYTTSMLDFRKCGIMI